MLNANEQQVLPAPSFPGLDADRLQRALREAVRGEVRFDDGSRALYATDGSNYRQVPIGVVIPRDKEDVIAAVRVCRQFKAPILARGCGTSLAGQCCNVAVVIDMSKYMRHVIEIDPDNHTARVQPGCVLDDLRRAAEQFHLTFAPDPATHSHNTLGGMIGNNSCGPHAVMGGRTAENILELEILTYTGERFIVGGTSEEEYQQILAAGGKKADIYRRLRDLRDQYADQIRQIFPKIPRRVSGFGLEELLPENGFNVARALVGSECTCVLVLEAKVQLVYSPPVRIMAVLGYEDVDVAGDHVPLVMAQGPTALEGMDEGLIQDMRKTHLHVANLKLLPEGHGWLLAEFGGRTVDEANMRADQLINALKKSGHMPHIKRYDGHEEQEKLWAVREAGLGATAHVPGEPPFWPGWEDSAVPPGRIGDYMRDLRKLYDKYGYKGDFYGHFGQGIVHTRISFDLFTADGLKQFKSFMHEAAHLCVRYGGSLSGEHGDGQARGPLLEIMFGKALMQAFREFKTIWDPDWKMNPGKVIDAYGLTENLRLGTQYAPPQPVTFFKYPQDRHSFSYATLRCVGVGKCRREGGGTMCPSYMATHEEMHCTRGRARLLFEMLNGAEIKDGWKSEAVKESLDLCLSCKGCKGDCPVHVDMATYKAEFLGHYYEERLRPISAYAFGLIDRWSHLASYAPGLANLVTQTPGLRSVAKAVVRMPQARTIPAFAPRTFKDWFFSRPHASKQGEPVILWPDTFNNYYYPETAVAATQILEDAGFRVLVPRQAFCCGRPLYEFGMLDRAQAYLRQIMQGLREPIDHGVRFVVLEPACASVFKDELGQLFPNDQVARRLTEQTYLLSDFLAHEAKDYQLPRLSGKALLHGHCHHKSILGMEPEIQLLRQMGLDLLQPETGCCGMAGSFGFEKSKYDVSVACGERVLLPTVRQVPDDVLIITDGFSCREQIKQMTDRSALHFAEVLALAKRQETLADRPETDLAETRRAGVRFVQARAAIGLAAALGVLWGMRRIRR